MQSSAENWRIARERVGIFRFLKSCWNKERRKKNYKYIVRKTGTRSTVAIYLVVGKKNFCFTVFFFFSSFYICCPHFRTSKAHPCRQHHRTIFLLPQLLLGRVVFSPVFLNYTARRKKVFPLTVRSNRGRKRIRVFGRYLPARTDMFASHSFPLPLCVSGGNNGIRIPSE